MPSIPLEAGYCADGVLAIGWLRLFLGLGVAVDVLGGLALTFFPDRTARLLRVPVQGNDFWPHYAAVFLFVVPLFYLIAALNPVRHLANVAGAILARFIGFAFYFSRRRRHPWLLRLSLMNAAFVVVYLYLTRGVSWSCWLASLSMH